MSELFFRKSKDGMWICYDRNGNQAKGWSKDNARNNYFLAYQIKEETNTIGIDISRYNNIG